MRIPNYPEPKERSGYKYRQYQSTLLRYNPIGVGVTKDNESKRVRHRSRRLHTN